MTVSLAGRDLLSIADLDRAEIDAILALAVAAKGGAELGVPLRGRAIAMIFQRPSNRTRVSFEVAIHRLGGHPIALFNPEVQLGERESAADISRILDRYVDGIVARLVSHRDLITIAAAAQSPVINALTDSEHPCQVLADCMTVRSVTGRLAGATVAYIGDGNNVLNSLLLGNALSASSRDQLTQWLLANTTGGTRLRAGVPANWRVGDKTGTGDHGSTNDIGILWPPNAKPLLVCAYLTGTTASADQRNATIAAVGRAISESFHP